MSAPAGWYQDPSVAGSVRFWDGAQWSAHTAHTQSGPGVYAPSARDEDNGPSSAIHYVIPVGRSWESITAPYLGLASLVPLPLISQAFGIAAITLGILALRRASSGGHGTGRAIVAIVLGALGAIGSIVLYVARPSITGNYS